MEIPTSKADTPPNLNFQWEVLEHDAYEMLIQLSFEDTESVSLTAKDKVRVRVIDLDQMLRAKETLRFVKPKNITLERCEYS